MPSSNSPQVSIIIPCRNEAEHIAPCLESIFRQESPPGGFEIIVADGRSVDGTREFLEQMASRRPELQVLDNPGRIVSTGLNAAIRAARGEIIIRMDAHTCYAPDYVKQCLAVLEETGADNVGGPMRTQARTYLEEAIRAAFHSPFSVGGALSHNVNYEGPVDSVIYGCWRKSLFEKVGYFDEALIRNQDDEHNLRLTRAGRIIYQSPRIRSWYQVRGSLPALFRQYMQYGYWKVLVIRKHHLPASWRHLAPGSFLVTLFLLAILTLFWLPALWLLAAVIGSYLLAGSVASVWTARHSGWKLLPLLPLVFGCFHFGFGYGFIRGLIDFVLLRRVPGRRFLQLTRQTSASERTVEFQ